MATPILTPSMRAEVGKFYMVPCLRTYGAWYGFNGWIPVFGPEHTDAEHLNFGDRHFHIDWRFAAKAAWEEATEGSRSALRKVASNAPSAPVLRRLKAKRAMPQFPERGSLRHYGRDVGAPWRSLERAQAFVCNKLKPGNICPHRGIDLTPFIKEDGTVVCPGHGLRWNTKTGELLPHHARAA